MKKILCALSLCILLSGCFGEKNTDTDFLDQQSWAIIELQVSTWSDLEQDIWTIENSVESQEVDKAQELQNNQNEALLLEDPQDVNDEWVRSNIENNPDAIVVEQNTTVIPTVPTTETEETPPIVNEEDSNLWDEVVEEFENELNELFDLLESDA